jgi:NAD(P)-dependent dehydrogenase (short-subunit alcohol dehydrogenase family)
VPGTLSPLSDGERSSQVGDLDGKVAVVTGASRGLGQRVAWRLAQQGAMVALLARSEAALQDTQSKMAANGARTLVVPVDLREPLSIEQVKGEIESGLGTPSILFNVAGVFGPIDLVKDSDPAPWIETILINTVGPYLTCRAFVGGTIGSGWAALSTLLPLRLCTRRDLSTVPTARARRLSISLPGTLRLS